jgi:tetratricopeptide (TPR) repeat protein
MRRQTLNAADAGEGDPVVNRLRQQIAVAPENVAARLELAAHYGRVGYPELELEHLRVAVERFSGSPEARIALARALRGNGQHRQAAEALEAFLGANPAHVEVLNLLGICYDDLGEWKAGEQIFRRALVAAGERPPDYLHNNLGHNLLEQQRAAEAVAELQQALRLNPRSETARNNLGLALARSPGAGVAEALRHFETVTDAATAHSNLAAALIEQGRYQESRQLLEAALSYSRFHSPALANARMLAELDGGPVAVGPARNLPWPLAFLRWMFWPETKTKEDRTVLSRR